ncbi:hypothetical protein GCM10017653_00600 [Ancylobacter defluvii]|uniref:Uncharacterized protein n=1 Tax=Ancylobacter defluvii TaxID=1282440 RepID=A0A9W6JQP3_9HYPH|nr:hypothetical protein GCM10017653_00600 [Ancylobacter defluvii]
MHQMAVDIEEAGAILLAVDDVVVKDLVVQGAGSGHAHPRLLNAIVTGRVGYRPMSDQRTAGKARRRMARFRAALS